MQPLRAQLLDQLPLLRRRALYLLDRYRVDQCRETAAALTYISLFALVPLLTVLFTMASVAPAFQGLEIKMQELLFENLIPETSEGLQSYLTDFARQARNLTGFGIVFLVVTAILMLRSIEAAFNRIWRAHDNRGPVPSFLLYWAVLSLAPITIGLGLAASAWLASFAHVLEAWYIEGVAAALLRIAPYLLQIAGFALVYASVPNCRVPLSHALVGGVVAGIAFNVARYLFTRLFAGSSITFIYGAFAAVPLFLLWIFISWNIVLMAAVIVHSLSAYQSIALERRPLLLKALEVLELLWRRQEDGRGLGELELLQREELRVDSESWQKIRDVLVARRVIVRNEDGHYMLSRDLHQISLWRLQTWLTADGEIVDDGCELPSWERRAVDLLKAQRQRDSDMLDISLAKLFEQ